MNENVTETEREGTERKRKDRESSGGEESFLERKEGKRLEMEGVQVILERINSAQAETLRTLRDEIHNAKVETNNLLKGEIERLNASLHDVKSENEQLRREVDFLLGDTKGLREEIEALKGGVRFQSDVQNDYGQYLRRNNVKIYGLKEEEGEDEERDAQTHVKVLKLFNEKLNVHVSDADIDIAHRIGNKTNDRTRSIVVRFTRRTVRNEVTKNRKKLKGEKIVIADDLTPSNMRLFYRMRDLLGDHKKVWTTGEGKILVKIGTFTRKVTLQNEGEIVRMVREGRVDSGLEGRVDWGPSGRGQSRGQQDARDERDARGEGEELGAWGGTGSPVFGGGSSDLRGFGRGEPRGRGRGRGRGGPRGGRGGGRGNTPL